jgi:hypothetical protein
MPGYDLSAISRENTMARDFMLSNGNWFEDIPSDDLTDGAVWGKKLTRVILPENVFTPASSPSSAVKFTVFLDAQYNPSCTIGVNETGTIKNFTLPHNHNLKINGNVAMPLLLDITASDWGLVGIGGEPQENRWVNVSETATKGVVTPLDDLYISFSSNQPRVTLDPNTVIDGQTQPLSRYYKDLTNGTTSNFSYVYNDDTKTGKGFIRLSLIDEPIVPASLGEHLLTLKLSEIGSEGYLDYKINVKNALWFAYAPPGVIGIRKSDRKLTLRGSSTYAGQTEQAFTSEEFGTPAQEPVYMVYFKWGSTIAVTNADGDIFDKNDIVWAPSGYKNIGNPALALEKIRSEVAAGVNAQAQWDLIPYGDLNGRSNTATTPTWPSTDDSKGLGNPCAYVEEGTDYADMPRGNPWQEYGGYYPFGSVAVETTNYQYWHDDIPSGPSSAGILSDYVYLPAAGWRTTSGLGYMSTSEPVGLYWSSTPGTGTEGYAIMFNSDYMRPSVMTSYAHGVAVRCTKMLMIE